MCWVMLPPHRLTATSDSLKVRQLGKQARPSFQRNLVPKQKKAKFLSPVTISVIHVLSWSRVLWKKYNKSVNQCRSYFSLCSTAAELHAIFNPACRANEEILRVAHSFCNRKVYQRQPVTFRVLYWKDLAVSTSLLPFTSNRGRPGHQFTDGRNAKPKKALYLLLPAAKCMLEEILSQPKLMCVASFLWEMKMLQEPWFNWALSSTYCLSTALLAIITNFECY